ncbi:MAG TPA: endonuclease III [Malonomonas sp.]
MKKTERALALLALLETAYPDAHCALNYTNAWQLLVATILSAQCTDVRVNLVTVELFKAYPTPQLLAAASQEQVEELIRSTGFFRNKAKNLILCAEQLLQRHAGQVPQTLNELVALAGVGRKTANVVLGNAYQIPGMVVDTHVKRLSRRFGWTRFSDPVQIEKDLCRLLPPPGWTQAGHTLIAHGRACCKAPTPVCSHCPVADCCPRIGVDKSR